MPIRNDGHILWTGWLVDGLGGQEEAYQKALVAALDTRQIPRSGIKTGTVNMWERKDSRYIDVYSVLDGHISSTIHIQEYGTSLWVGRAVELHSQSNYYKRMAEIAFIEVVDRCIRETTLTLVDAVAIHEVADIGQEK